MTSRGQILQIVPRAPGSREGVGDYAQMLAAGLREEGYETTFAAAHPTESADVLSPLDSISAEEWRQHPAAAIVLHYVNYGYHRRGIPRALPGKIAQIQELCGARLLTIFHELYAVGSWRQSAFWLGPIQRRIARNLAEKSAVCVVSSEVLARQLHQLAPRAPLVVRPVVSTFGEPRLSPAQISGRDPRRWAICGGSELIERSLRSFLRAFRGPEELFVLGGADRPLVRQLLAENTEITAHYLPNVAAAVASEILSSCSLGWIDYFDRPDIATAAILKSTAFAAYCAHAVIPVLPAAPSPVALNGDALPGPFSLPNLPAAPERPAIAQATYDWYGRNASSAHLAACIAEVIGS